MNYLSEIIAYKKEEAATLHHLPRGLQEILGEKRPISGRFAAALKKPGLSVIGEVKRRSPSLGDIGPIEDRAERYYEGGAAAISVLTDGKSFGGSIDDLKKVAATVPLPILRKDFIIHPLQLAEAAQAGATAVLLIAGLLGKHLMTFLMLAERLGLETLTEIHNEAELELALKAEAPIIGVNHRNLQTFAIDMSLSEKLRPLIPPRVIAVAESGIHTPEQARRMSELGYDAILVGESLVRSPHPEQLIREMRGDV